MVAEATGRIARRKDGKHFLYLPKHLVEDTAFPFYTETSIPVKVVIDRPAKRLLVTSLRQNPKPRRKRS